MRLLTMLAGIAIAVSGAVTVCGFLAGPLDLGRILAIGDSWDTPSNPHIWLVAFTGLGPFLLLGTIISYVTANQAYSGDSRRLVAIDPATLALVGAAGGAWAFLPFWQQSGNLGSSLDHDERSVPWGAGEWVWHWLPLWIPLLLTAAAFVSLAVRLFRERSRRRRNTRVAQLMASGVRTTGAVTEGGYLNHGGGDTITPWTFQFVDAHGTTRWVRRHGRFPGETPPFRGERVTVLHDPAHPGDESRIFVARGNPDAPHAFTEHLW